MSHRTSPAGPSHPSLSTSTQLRSGSNAATKAPSNEPDPAAKTFLDSGRSSISSETGPPHGTSNNRHNPLPQLRTTSSNQRLRRPPVYSRGSSEEFKGTPKERLQALLASSTRKSPVMSDVQEDGDQISTLPRQTPSPATGLNRGSPRLHTSTATPGRYASARNNSLDSTMSSRSETSAPSSATVMPSPKVSMDGSTREVDAASCIAASGSAEAAVEKLLREKQLLETKHNQLWSLLEKARTMIVGLSEDNAKSKAQTERYKQRLKDQEALLANKSDKMPSSHGRPSHRTSGASDVLLNSTPGTKSSVANKRSSRVTKEELVAQGPNDQAGSSTHQDSLAPDTDLIRKPTPEPLALRQRNAQDGPISPEGLNTGRSYIVSPAMSSPGDSKRKAPPKPLKLASTGSVSSTKGQVADETSEGDEASPELNRGRRKTRADDDRIREESYAAEQERRSRSKKEKSKSKSKPPEDEAIAIDDPFASAKAPTALANGVGLPTSPRAPMLGALQSPLQDLNMASIGGMINRQDNGAYSTRDPNPALTALKSPGLPMSPRPSNPAFAALKSPGLPMSPRPGGQPMNAAMTRMAPQTITAPLNSPGPMSPRGGILSPRPPRQPILLPNNNHFNPAIPISRRAQVSSTSQSSLDGRLQSGSSSQSQEILESQDIEPIYRGLVDDYFPELLAPPSSLSKIRVLVDSSRLRPPFKLPSSGKVPEDDFIFTLLICARAGGQHLWRLEKTLASLFAFDQTIRQVSDFSGKLPDRNLFANHAPVKVDQCRSMLYHYFVALLESSLDEHAALMISSFLSNNAIGARKVDPTKDVKGRSRKAGYLSKKGKSFGGWKSRFFKLDGQDLQYYESTIGEHLGSIKLHGAQIGQQMPENSTEDSEYRHGVIILEQKKDDSSHLIRHVLCAESDDERDDWIHALKAYVEGLLNQPPGATDTPKQSPVSSSKPNVLKKTKPIQVTAAQERTMQFQTMSYDQAAQAAAPTMISPSNSDESTSPIPDQGEFGNPQCSKPEHPRIW